MCLTQNPPVHATNFVLLKARVIEADSVFLFQSKMVQAALQEREEALKEKGKRRQTLEENVRFRYVIKKLVLCYHLVEMGSVLNALLCRERLGSLLLSLRQFLNLRRKAALRLDFSNEIFRNFSYLLK